MQNQPKPFRGQSQESLDEKANCPEIVVLTKTGGELTKRISLNGDTFKSDGSACFMGRGEAERKPIPDVHALAALIEGLRTNQAIALGALRDDLPDRVTVVTKGKLNGSAAPNIIARTANDITYRAGQPGFILKDFDTKGMPRDVADRIDALGGFWNALVAVIPDLATAAHVIRRSTSSGLSRADTGHVFKGSDGVHVFVHAKDVADAVRFLTALHQRCWLAGFGWIALGAAGQMLERSIVDRMVGAPERLVFEGGPVVEAPIVQDAESRRPMAFAGEVIDTVAICPSLTAVEHFQLRKLIAEAKQRIQPQALHQREAYVADRAQKLAARTGMSIGAATRIIERQCGGVLLADVELPLDDNEEGRVVTVADVLDNPATFEGWTLADPLEGVEYGRGKAKIMRHADGTPFIHSFAHGGGSYQLRYDARAVERRIEQAENPIETFIKCMLLAELDPVEEKRFIGVVSKRAGVGVKIVTDRIKDAKAEHAKQRKKETRERKLAERTDPRPQIASPGHDAPWLPVMSSVNEVVGRSPDKYPPIRDMDNDVSRARRVQIPGMHAFGSKTANAEANEEGVEI
jgi:hypothetical protein